MNTAMTMPATTPMPLETIEEVLIARAIETVTILSTSEKSIIEEDDPKVAGPAIILSRNQEITVTVDPFKKNKERTNCHRKSNTTGINTSQENTMVAVSATRTMASHTTEKTIRKINMTNATPTTERPLLKGVSMKDMRGRSPA